MREREITHSPTRPFPCSVTVTLTALALGWLIGLRYPFFPERGERLLLLALPPFILLVAAALDALWVRARWAAIATLGLVVAMSAASLAAFYLVPRYPGDDYRPLIARTVEQGLPEDTVFAIYPWQVGYWRSYGSVNGPTALLTPDADWTPGVAAALDAALARGKVWFPAHLALGAILEKQVEAHLAGRAAPFINEWYGPGTRLERLVGHVGAANSRRAACALPAARCGWRCGADRRGRRPPTGPRSQCRPPDHPALARARDAARPGGEPSAG